jgi:hypothetical protein
MRLRLRGRRRRRFSERGWEMATMLAFLGKLQYNRRYFDHK